MNTNKLSDRLATVAKYIPEGSSFADIGSDHAYLPCHVVQSGKAVFAIAGEVVEGPFQSARKQVQMEGLTDKIEVRKGNGLEVIQPGEVDCITIAGMGGALISQILDEGKSKLDSVKRLVLQPNISAISIRTWLLDHNWTLVEEEILEEDGKIYEVLVAEKGNAFKAYNKNKMDEGLLMGPYLIQKQSEAFLKKWSNEMENWKRILDQLDKANETIENQQKKQELLDKIKMVEETLKQ
ncbi:tRNA (adenine(22)-N(1))-methyltransferase [Cytobacillus sp. FJAT-54145]|uniref:tRNA (Adenine(22)-N(1))-methyltransferase n=1 Tax=Cytobacillus spartinae TaxID=3299023 RepID=A0ABW6KG16_9BACI